MKCIRNSLSLLAPRKPSGRTFESIQLHAFRYCTIVCSAPGSAIHAPERLKLLKGEARSPIPTGCIRGSSRFARENLSTLLRRGPEAPCVSKSEYYCSGIFGHYLSRIPVFALSTLRHYAMPPIPVLGSIFNRTSTAYYGSDLRLSSCGLLFLLLFIQDGFMSLLLEPSRLPSVPFHPTILAI